MRRYSEEMSLSRAFGPERGGERDRGDRDYRGSYGFGRRAHGSDPKASYAFTPADPRNHLRWMGS